MTTGDHYSDRFENDEPGKLIYESPEWAEALARHRQLTPAEDIALDVKRYRRLRRRLLLKRLVRWSTEVPPAPRL